MVCKNKHFLFEAAQPGVVKAQLVANGAYTEFNLLKTKKRVFPKLSRNYILFHSSSNSTSFWITRQEYLYHNIRPFVRDEFKDLTCPQPIYTGNE